jgi:hypothetical protein
MAIDFKPLTITPVNFSLTEGTTIPAPLDSPPRTPVDGQSPNAENTAPDATAQKAQTNTSTPDSKQAPLSPLSATSPASQQKRKVNGVRKFFSMRASRTDSTHNKLHKQSHQPVTSPSAKKMSYDNSRPTSPLSDVDAAVSSETEPTAAGDTPITLKHKRSAGWFNSTSGRRKSNLFVIGRLDERIAQDNDTAEKTAERKRKAGPPPPAIPELESFAVGMDGGELGGAELFKDIGKDITVDDLEKSPKTAKLPITDAPVKATESKKKTSLPDIAEKSEVTPASPSVEQLKTEQPKETQDIKSSVTEESTKPTPMESTTEPAVTEAKDKSTPVHSGAKTSEAKVVEEQTAEPENIVEPIHTEKADSATNVVLEQPIEAKAPVEAKESGEAKEPVSAKEAVEVKEPVQAKEPIAIPNEAPIEAPQEIAEKPAEQKPAVEKPVEAPVEAPVEVQKSQNAIEAENIIAPAEDVKEEVVEKKEEQS